MKKKLLWLLLCSFITANAQLVNIQDAYLKSAILATTNQGGSPVVARNIMGTVIAVDANGDGQIQLAEAQAVWILSINVPQAVSLAGLESFTNVRKLDVKCGSTALDFTLMPQLLDLNCSDMQQLTSLNISGLTSLLKLDCSNTSLTSLSLQGLLHLEKADLSMSSISELDLTGLVALEELNCNGNNISTLTISGNGSLKKLQCVANNIQTLQLSEAPALEILECGENNFSTLDTSSLTMLVSISCHSAVISSPLILSANTLLNSVYLTDAEIPSVVLGDMPELIWLNCVSATIGNIEIGFAPNLQTIDISESNVRSIDCSGCPSLGVFRAFNCPLEYVNLKNGSTLNYFLADYVDILVDILTICADEDEFDFFINYFQNGPNPSATFLNLTSYCSITPGGNFNTISGVSAMYDNDSMTCNIPLPNICYSASQGSTAAYAISNQSGNYNLYTQTGTFTITPQLENSGWFTITPPSASISFTNNNNNTATQNFCISPNGSHPDLEIIISPVIGARPGFDAVYRIIYRNKGNQLLSGDVSFTYDDAVMDFVSATIAPTVSATGSMNWSYTNLLPLETRHFNVTLNMNGPMENPPLINGNNISFSASITPAVGDEMPADNAFILAQTLVGSYDPNDITCLEGDTEHPDSIGKYLHYNINFENTGTAPATFIVVKDIIDAAKFDVSSLQLIEASHNVATRINGNKVEFYFDAINLGPNEKGNVVFKIKTLPTLTVNSSVTQNVNIYFDYNWPIVTNDATTTFQLLSAGDFNRDATVKLFPNPAATQVSITAQSPITSIQLFDVQGRLLEALSPKMQEATLDVSGRTKGIYFVKVMTGSGVKVEKLVKE